MKIKDRLPPPPCLSFSARPLLPLKAGTMHLLTPFFFWSCAKPKQGCCGHQTAIHMIDARAHFVHMIYTAVRSCGSTSKRSGSLPWNTALLVLPHLASLAVHLYPLFTSAEPIQAASQPSSRGGGTILLRSCICHDAQALPWLGQRPALSGI